MSENRYFYNRDDSFTSADLGADFRYITNKDHDDIGDAEDDEDSEFLQDVPYSSSSLDRSSIGSIPWADDAIKKNQLDWERVERMLCGQEELTDEPELRNEILGWQKKFPHLISSNPKVATSPEKQQQQSFESPTFKTGEPLDIDSIANLKLDSLSDGDEDFDDTLVTPTNEDQQLQQQQIICSNRALHNRRHMSVKTMGLAALTSFKQKPSLVDPANVMKRDLRINSVPLTLRKKNQKQNKNDQTPEIYSTDSDNRTGSYPLGFSPPTPPTRYKLPTSFKDSTTKLLIVPPSQTALSTNYATATNANMRMPPILNVLESKRRFRGLVNNRSFVQLTQVQQAKSAAVTSQQRSVGYAGGTGSGAATKTARQSTWHLPLAAATMSNRFFNNRNSIILPAINLQHLGENPALTSSGGEMISGSSNYSAATRENVAHRQHNFHHMTPQRAYYQQNRTRMSTTTTTTPSTGGRSISAAVHPQSRYEFNAFYLPYSASKFKVFK